MIAYLQGKILQKNQQSLILLTGQIGYEVFLSKPYLEELIIGKNLELFIYTKVREDELTLFGFQKMDQLNFFKDLISVKGIGPKIALEILSNNIDQTKNAIIMENAAYLSKVPGIGKKTAERIIVELKNKVQPGELSAIPIDLETKFEEVIDALSGLGYQRGEVSKVLKNLPTEITTSEAIITYFLKHV